jgi:isoquinoline 1-oxidoreductase subunit beta
VTRVVLRTRRRFLGETAAAGIGLLVAFELPGCKTVQPGAAPGDFAPNAWIRVRPDGRVVFVLDRIEMGQGVTTSHAMLVAEELGLEPEDLEIEIAHADRKYDNPELGFQITGGSTSVVSSFAALRVAGAVVREALAGAAAAELGVPRAELTLERGFFLHRASGKRIDFAACAPLADRYVDEAAQPKPFGAHRLIGKDHPRLDVPAKVNGTATFGIDVRLPNMLTAVIIRSPVFGGKLVSADFSEAAKLPGVHSIVPLENAIAVLADGYWYARRAAERVRLKWSEREISSTTISALFDRALAQKGKAVRDDGDATHALAQTKDVIDAEIEFPYLAHATMEPQNCTARVEQGRCEVWAPTQSPGSAKKIAALAAGVSESEVEIHATLLGGGFGRRIGQDYVAEAVTLARRSGRPVQVIWSREDDLRGDIYRPGSKHRVRAGVKDGKPCGWFHRIATPSVISWAGADFAKNIYPLMPGFMADLLSAMYRGTVTDQTSVEGALELPYAIADVRVEWSWADPGVPLGFWRSVGHSFNAFVVETIIDELAERAGADPVEFRRTLLGGAPKHLRVLDLVAERSGWKTPTPAGRARGIAIHESFKSRVAQVAEVSIANGEVRVHRVVAAVDCGRVINPNIVRAQIESGVIFGLTAALKSKITFERGRVVEGNFNDYPLLRIYESPEIEVHLLESDDPPTGVGEPGVPPIAPAVANAIRKLTGKPVRRLPIGL